MDSLIQDLEQTAKSEETAAVADRAKPAGKSKARWFIAGGLAVAAAVGAATYLHFRDRVSTDDAQVDAHIAPVAPKIAGNIAEILVDDNQPVWAGQVLVRIDARDYAAKVAQARAA